MLFVVWILALARLRRTLAARSSSTYTYPSFKNARASTFRIATSSLPLVNELDVQDSWAGRLPLANDASTRYFFFYVPSSKQGGSNTLTIWLSGGPGCSSLNGVTQETGPFLIPPGADKAILNEEAWSRETDMLYIDQPATAGFSVGPTDDLTGEVPLAEKFYSFLVSFYEVFPELATKDLHIAAESYGAQYATYIARRILTASTTEKTKMPLSLKSLIVNDGTLTSLTVSMQMLVPAFAAANQAVLGFEDAFIQQLNVTAETCGFNDILRQVKYPMTTNTIELPLDDVTGTSCDLWITYYYAALQNNPCFDMHNVKKACPSPNDLIVSGEYFNRADVQRALGVDGNWSYCTAQYPFVNGVDEAPLSQELLPGLLAELPILLWHGMLDGIMLPGNERIMIQNTTWAGAQGFSSSTYNPLVVDGQAKGQWHSERGLTLIEVSDAGHFLTQDAPVVSFAVYKQWIESLSIGSGNLSSVVVPSATTPVAPSTPTVSLVAGGGRVVVTLRMPPWLETLAKKMSQYLHGLFS